jgi:hypothetical protein
VAVGGGRHVFHHHQRPCDGRDWLRGVVESLRGSPALNRAQSNHTRGLLRRVNAPRCAETVQKIRSQLSRDRAIVLNLAGPAITFQRIPWFSRSRVHRIRSARVPAREHGTSARDRQRGIRRKARHLVSCELQVTLGRSRQLTSGTRSWKRVIGMAVLVEAISVLVRHDAILRRFKGGWSAFCSLIPNAAWCHDDALSRIGFMTPSDVGL